MSYLGELYGKLKKKIDGTDSFTVAQSTPKTSLGATAQKKAGFFDDSRTGGIIKNTVLGLPSAAAQVIRKGPAAAYYDANPSAAKNIKTATAFRFPEELAKNMYSGTADFAKSAGNVFGTGLAYWNPGKKFGDYAKEDVPMDDLPTVKQMLGKTAVAGLEAYTPNFVSSAIKGKTPSILANMAKNAPKASKAIDLGLRVAKGAAPGYAYDVASHFSQGDEGPKAFRPGVGTGMGALFGVGLKPTAQMAKDIKQLHDESATGKALRWVGEAPQVIKNSLAPEVKPKTRVIPSRTVIPSQEHDINSDEFLNYFDKLKKAGYKPEIVEKRTQGNYYKRGQFNPELFDESGYDTPYSHTILGKVKMTIPKKTIEDSQKAKTFSEWIKEGKSALPAVGNSIEDVRKGNVPDDLMAEARKYKTAEEFVKLQITKDYVSEVKPTILKADDRSVFKTAGEARGNAREITNKEIEIAQRDQKIFDTNKNKTTKQLLREIDESKKFADENNTSYPRSIQVKEDIIKTKSQLTDLWKQANATKTPKTISQWLKEGKDALPRIGNSIEDVSKKTADDVPAGKIPTIQEFVEDGATPQSSQKSSTQGQTPTGSQGNRRVPPIDRNEAGVYPRNPERTSGQTLPERQEALRKGPSLEAKASEGNTPYGFDTPSVPNNAKNRKFFDTVGGAEKTKEPVKSGIDALEKTYAVKSNVETLEKAKQVLDNEDEALRRVMFGEASDENFTVGQLLIDKYQNSGQYEKAIDVVDAIAKKATEAGRTVQALSMYSRLTPEGVLRYAQRVINEANKERPKLGLKLSPEKAKELVEKAKKLQGETGYKKQVETSKLLQDIKNIVPPTLARKVSSLQTMAQLLNPKTAIRNIGGNLLFNIGENLSDALAAPVDAAVSMVTGKRTKTLPSVLTQMRAMKEELPLAFKEAVQGVDTRQLPTQFEIKGDQNFRGKIGQSLEKALAVVLKVPDRAFYRAAYDESLRQSMRAAGVQKPTQEMLERAHYDGLYRTFQDESVPAQLFMRVKRALNMGKDFGIGDMVLKYPKTPGNLLARALDYSPAGYAKAIVELAQPLFKGAFDQKRFVESLSRGTVGSVGLVGLGFYLGKMGIMTGQNEKDYDIESTQRSIGGGGNRLNVSALKRLVLSGFDAEEAKPKEGDTIMSYDWIQPFAVPIAAGIEAAKRQGSDARERIANVSTASMEALQAGVDTLANQPLVQGLKRLFGYGDVVGGIADTVKGAPSSFIPTLSNQVRQFTDNASRSTYDPNKVKQSYNMAAAKIPGLYGTLPQSYDVWGKPGEVYQDGSNTFLNVFFNPAFVSTLKADPASEEVLRIFQESGETQQAPRNAPKTVTINGEKVKLSGEDVETYQKYIGERTKEAFDNLMQTPDFAGLSDEEKASTMARIMTDINSAAKIELFGNMPKKPSTGAALQSGDMEEGTEAKQQYYDDLIREQLKSTDAKTWLSGYEERIKAIDGQLANPDMDDLSRLKLENEKNSLTKKALSMLKKDKIASAKASSSGTRKRAMTKAETQKLQAFNAQALDNMLAARNLEYALKRTKSYKVRPRTSGAPATLRRIASVQRRAPRITRIYA